MRTLIFSVRVNYDLPFRSGVDYSLDNLVKIDWNSTDELKLTRYLNQEIIKNYIWFKLIGIYCSYPKYYKYGQQLPFLKTKIGFEEYHINENICEKFYRSNSAYTDLFNRDEKAMVRTNYFNDLYAVVLLDETNYIGHVYVWISPSSKYGFMMGIRSNILMNYGIIQQFKGVSYYLLDAVRKFLIQKNVDNFIVPYPIGGMESKLKNLGFKYITLDAKELGNSGIMSPKGGPCEKCMLKEDIKNWDFKLK